MSARYAVFGNPIGHSMSPKIHALFAEQEGVQIEYERILVDNSPEAFEAAVHIFFRNGGSGANITVPFKEYAFRQSKDLSERALAAGAVNTLVRMPNGAIGGDNTDGLGLVQDIEQHLNFSIKNKKVLIIGAGGAGRGLVRPLLSSQPSSLTITNRSHDKALTLAKYFGIEAMHFAGVSNESFDLIINATSSSLYGEIPAVPGRVFRQCALAYDVMYSNQPTAFMRFAAEHGAERVGDGLGMLVCQAAFSYHLWRGFMPEALSVIMNMRADMSS